MEEDLEIKQNYLRSEVIEKGYSADLFVNFLSEINPESVEDLNSYTIEALKLIVNEFKKQQDSKEKEILDLQIPSENFDFATNLTLSSIPTSRADYEEIITCKKMSKTPLTDIENLKITISDPELKTGGFFSSSYHNYLITTQSINSKVRRRFSDFVWLREALLESYPGIFIPPIPEKKLMEKTNEQLANKRMRYLQVNFLIKLSKKFLDAIVKHHIIKSSKILFSFLTIEDKDEFPKVKSFYSKQSSPSMLKDFENIEGVIQLKITSEKDAKAKLINVETSTYEDMFGQLNESFKYLLVEMETVGVRLKEISNIFNKIHQCSEISQDVPDTMNTYKMMTSLTGSWGKVYDTQAKVINDDIREFFNYMKKELKSFKELIVEYQEAKANYISYDTKLRNRKEDLFVNGNISKWELNEEDLINPDRIELFKNKEYAFSKMLFKDSNYCISLKRNYGFHLTALIEEYSLYQKNRGRRFKNHFLNLSAKNTAVLSDIFAMVKLLTLSC